MKLSPLVGRLSKHSPKCRRCVTHCSYCSRLELRARSEACQDARNSILLACSEAMTASSTELAELLCEEQGKPLSSATKEVEWAINSFKKAANVRSLIAGISQRIELANSLMLNVRCLSQLRSFTRTTLAE